MNHREHREHRDDLEADMDETTRKIIERITVTSEEPMVLPNGKQCSVFYDCAQLTPSELARLAAEAVGDLDEGTFEVAVGVAYNGILFAAAIAGGRDVAILQTDGKLWGAPVSGRKVLIVDDVVLTGSRVLEAARQVESAGGQVIGFSAIVDRSAGQFGNQSKPFYPAFSTSMK